MSEDAENPDADDDLPEPRDADAEDVDAEDAGAEDAGAEDAGAEDAGAEDVDAADDHGEDGQAEDVESGRTREADLPDRTPDTGDAEDDAPSPSKEQEPDPDRLPDVDRETDDDLTADGRQGIAGADSTAGEAAETSTEGSSAPTADDSERTDESTVAEDSENRDTDAAMGPDSDAEAEAPDDSPPSAPPGGFTGLFGGDASDRRAEDFEEGELPPRDLDRAFSILEEAFTSDAFGGQQLDQLLTVFEGAMTGDGDTDPEAVMELIAMLEQLILEPDDLTEVDVGGFLSIFEEAITGSTGVSEEDIGNVFDVLEEGLRDPTSIDPEDVERFRTGVESAIMDITDPSSGGFGGLFALPGMVGEEAVPPDESGDDAVDMFRIARIAAGMTQRATGYSMETGVRTGTRMAYAAANSHSPAELLTNTRAIALDELQRAGIDIGADQQDWLDTHEDELVHPRPVTREALQERGEALLQESAEIGVEESIHPSYPMILDELASDEARILRLLATEGPQGVVDVYERKYIPFTLTLVARNLTMLGADAGCREKEQTPIYVENLQRLGLVAVRDTPIDDLKRYQVIQAQPHVEAARDSVKRAKTKYKSIELTAFGREFCRLCFPFQVTDETAYETFRSADGE